MTIVDELTPVYYGLQRGKLIVRGTTADTLEFELLVNYYNEAKEVIESQYLPLVFGTAQKDAFISAIAAELALLEAETSLTRYEPPPQEPPQEP